MSYKAKTLTSKKFKAQRKAADPRRLPKVKSKNRRRLRKSDSSSKQFGSGKAQQRLALFDCWLRKIFSSNFNDKKIFETRLLSREGPSQYCMLYSGKIEMGIALKSAAYPLHKEVRMPEINAMTLIVNFNVGSLMSKERVRKKPSKGTSKKKSRGRGNNKLRARFNKETLEVLQSRIYTRLFDTTPMYIDGTLVFIDSEKAIVIELDSSCKSLECHKCKPFNTESKISALLTIIRLTQRVPWQQLFAFLDSMWQQLFAILEPILQQLIALLEQLLNYF